MINFNSLFAPRRGLPPPAPRMSSVAESSVTDSRRELLLIAVRDVLRRHGIPQHWIAPEPQGVMTRQRERGMHLRLVLREWQPRLLACSVALQRAVRTRVLRLDPLSPAWFTGVSWRFDLVDESGCPDLPPPEEWQLAAESGAALLQERDRAFRGRGDAPDFCPTQPMLHPDGATAS